MIAQQPALASTLTPVKGEASTVLPAPAEGNTYILGFALTENERFVSQGFGRELTSFPGSTEKLQMTLKGWRLVKLDEQEIVRLRPHLAGKEVNGLTVPAFQFTGDLDDSITGTIFEVSLEEREGWDAFSFNKLRAEDGPLSKGIYDFVSIEYNDPEGNPITVRLETVPQGYGEIITREESNELIPEALEPILASDLKGLIDGVDREKIGDPMMDLEGNFAGYATRK